MDLDPTQIIELATPYVTGGVMAIVILTVGWFVAKWGYRAAHTSVRKAGFDEALARFAGQCLQYSLLAFTVIAALGKVGIETTSVIAVLASAGFAVGLALQGSLSNFASGVMLLFFRPFHLGDLVTTAGHTAKVRDIGLFATTLMTPANDKIIVPNSAITSGSIVNHTTEGTRRAGIDIGVAYGSSLEHVAGVVKQAAASVALVLPEPAPALLFTEMAASSLNFKLQVWSKSDDFVLMQHQVRTACYNALEEANIEIPFDQIVVHNAMPEAAAAAK